MGKEYAAHRAGSQGFPRRVWFPQVSRVLIAGKLSVQYRRGWSPSVALAARQPMPLLVEKPVWLFSLANGLSFCAQTEGTKAHTLPALPTVRGVIHCPARQTPCRIWRSLEIKSLCFSKSPPSPNKGVGFFSWYLTASYANCQPIAFFLENLRQQTQSLLLYPVPLLWFQCLDSLSL